MCLLKVILSSDNLCMHCFKRFTGQIQLLELIACLGVSSKRVAFYIK